MAQHLLTLAHMSTATQGKAFDFQSRWLQIILGLTVVMNLMDAILTLVVVKAGLTVEANPLMADLLARSPLQFMVGKLALVSLGILLLWRWRHHVLSMVGSVCIFAVYSSIIVHHITGIEHLVLT